MPIQYRTGDATRPEGGGPKIIAHICNDVGAWGKGFVLALSKRWKTPEEQYRAWHAGQFAAPFQLGEVQFVQVEEDLWVANMIAQHGLRWSQGRPPIRYEALRQALRRVAEFAQQQQASIHMPRIGAGLAGGDWSIISRIIEEELCRHGLEVVVYDLPQKGGRSQNTAGRP